MPERIDTVLDELARGEKPSFRLTKDEAAELISGIRLNQGGGNLAPPRGRNQLICIMQAANLYNAALDGAEVQGGSFPNYTGIDEVCPVIEQFMICVNDNCSNEDRQRLLQYVPRLLNTRVDEKTSRRSAILRDVVAEWTWSWWLKSGRHDDPCDIVDDLDDNAGVLTWDKDGLFNPNKVRKAMWVATVRDTIDVNCFSDEGTAFIQALIAREGFDAVLRLANRLLRAR